MGGTQKDYVTRPDAAAEIALETQSSQPLPAAPHLTFLWFAVARLLLALDLTPSKGQFMLRRLITDASAEPSVYPTEQSAPLVRLLVKHEVESIFLDLLSQFSNLTLLAMATLLLVGFLTHSLDLIRGWFLLGAFLGTAVGFALVREAWRTRRGTIAAVCLYISGFVMLGEVALLFRAAIG